MLEEIQRFAALDVPWQQEESLINVYLFACAIACTVDDSLARPPWRLAVVARRFPRLRSVIARAEFCLNAPDALRRLAADRYLQRWRRGWDGAVERACDLLLAGPPAAAAKWAEHRAVIEGLMTAPLPARARDEKMRLPEGFRCQDLAHQDVIELRDPDAPVVIVGVRTAGAYFAPLVKAVLSAEGWTNVSWMTVRPKLGVSRWEARELRRLGRTAARVAVVDDHPNTGLTARLALDLLARHGVQPRRVTVVVPRHPVRPHWVLPPGEVAGPERLGFVTLEPEELHKARLIEPASMEPLLREYHGSAENVRVAETSRVQAINARLAGQLGDGFQVRLKRVFALSAEGADGESATRHVFAKSVGWGWLGYHAYLMAARLEGCVPPLIGLRHGLLLTEWLDEGPAGPPEQATDRLVGAVALYTARRVRGLALPQDPCFGSPEYRWTGWDEMIHILRGAYGPYVGRLKAPVLRRLLEGYVSPVPTVVDGRMRREEWIETSGGVLKADFEQHNFGGAELDVVDPAYDLAGAIYELELPESAARGLVDAYARASGDRTVDDRLLLYELLYGVVAMQRAARDAAEEPRRERLRELNRRCLGARRFLVSRMNRLQAGQLASTPPGWSERLFFLDVDGVFDCEVLGFPHTTPSGPAALRLLRSHDVSVVLNTGRGVDDVRDYCRAYGLPGGLGEFGSVFVDAVAGRELTLIDAEAVGELARCREALALRPGMCLDPGYRHSIRAYRYRNGRTAGLEAAEIAELLEHARCDRLTAILRPEDSYIVRKGTSKAAGVTAVNRYLGHPDKPGAAIGDSRHDVEMLRASERAYAPANCDESVRALARLGRCRVMSRPYQQGLLAAVRDLVGEEPDRARPVAGIGRTNGDRRGGAVGWPVGSAEELVTRLLHAAERSPTCRRFVALRPRTL